MGLSYSFNVRKNILSCSYNMAFRMVLAIDVFFQEIANLNVSIGTLQIDFILILDAVESENT